LDKRIVPIGSPARDIIQFLASQNAITADHCILQACADYPFADAATMAQRFRRDCDPDHRHGERWAGGGLWHHDGQAAGVSVEAAARPHSARQWQGYGGAR
jgi:hypothetical protein